MAATVASSALARIAGNIAAVDAFAGMVDTVVVALAAETIIPLDFVGSRMVVALAAETMLPFDFAEPRRVVAHKAAETMLPFDFAGPTMVVALVAETMIPLDFAGPTMVVALVDNSYFLSFLHKTPIARGIHKHTHQLLTKYMEKGRANRLRFG